MDVLRGIVESIAPSQAGGKRNVGEYKIANFFGGKTAVTHAAICEYCWLISMYGRAI